MDELDIFRLLPVADLLEALQSLPLREHQQLSLSAPDPAEEVELGVERVDLGSRDVAAERGPRAGLD